MGLNRKVIKFIRGSEVKWNRFRKNYGEKKAIRGKKEIYGRVEWSKDQKARFDTLFKNNYGKKFPDKWNRLYESLGGVHNEKYLPEIILTRDLEYSVNQDKYRDCFGDKNILELLYGNDPDIKFAKAYLYNSFGFFTDGSRTPVSKEEAIKIFSDCGECVIKPTIESGSGKNVVLLNMVGGKNTKTGEGAASIIEKYGTNFTVQKKLSVCAELKELHPSSVTSVRVITYRCRNEIKHTPSVMRVGVKNNEVSNSHMGGLSLGIRDDGRAYDTAIALGLSLDKIRKYDAHPDTGVVFADFVMPRMKDIIAAAERIHARTPQLGIISWDFTVDEDYNIILIEANLGDQTAWDPQITTGEALFGDDTEYMLKAAKHGYKDE